MGKFEIYAKGPVGRGRILSHEELLKDLDVGELRIDPDGIGDTVKLLQQSVLILIDICERESTPPVTWQVVYDDRVVWSLDARSLTPDQRKCVPQNVVDSAMRKFKEVLDLEELLKK